MKNYCTSICKYCPESPEEAYSDDSPDDHEYPFYADDSQYFDIDISLPFSPTDSTPTSGEDDSEDEFDLDLSVCSASAPNPNQCISYVDNLLYQGQLLPLRLIPTPLEYDMDIKDIHASLQQFSSNVPAGVKTQFPKLLITAAKLKISLFGFSKSAKFGRDLMFPCAEYGTGIDMESPVTNQSRLLTVKSKAMEVPLVSFFTRDFCGGAKRDGNVHGFQKKSEDYDNGEGQSCKDIDRDKKTAKQIVQKYAKKIKPLYVKMLQRGSEKIRLRDLKKLVVRNGVKNGTCQSSQRSEKQLSFSYLSANLKMIYKDLGNGKKQPSDTQQKLPNHCMSSKNTLMEEQSAIQEAIAHCKQSNSIDDTSNSPNSRCSAAS